jgi:methionyl aminopeptidase
MAINTAGELITLKDGIWLARQKRAGRCVAMILRESGRLIAEKTPNLTLKDLENMALQLMKEMGCTATFQGYKGFPSAICTSVNKHLVHGIVTDYTIKDGDVVSVDLGATFEGAIADAACTFIYGESPSKEVTRMVQMCQDALTAGINAVKVGNRIGAIGDAIHKFVKDSGFGLITKYGGHGINYDTPHAPPFVHNRASKTEGVHITPGMSIAIEPMLVLDKDTQTTVLDDNWTVLAKSLACHFEHSVFVESHDRIHVITSTA